MADATRKTRTIERKLKNVEALPIPDETKSDIEVLDSENKENA